MRRALALLLTAGCGAAVRPASPPVATVTYVELDPTRPVAPAAGAEAELHFPLPGAVPCSRGFLPDDRHFALDLVAPAGTPVLASAPGLVVRASSHRDYGLTVVVEHAATTYTLYAHLSSLAVSVGDSVTAGATLGAVGDTGNARGAHLHWEVLRADAPLPLRADGPLGIPGGAYRVDPATVALGVPDSCAQRSSSPAVESSSLPPSGVTPHSRSAAFTAARSSDDVGP